MFSLQKAQALLQSRGIVAQLLGDGRTPVARVHTDTRTLQPGDLFVALKGERFDANDFLATAKAAGASAALAERGLAASGLPGLQVPDSLAALQALAQAWRARASLPVIAITGSNGKTTVTQMVAAILRAAHGDAALATQGNFNNHIGVPLTLLRLRPEGDTAHRSAVVELGMNHPGEIAELAAMAQPTVALVNNAQREHQEFMHTVEAVARENGAVLAALPADGVAVYPFDDAYTPVWDELAGERSRLRFALPETGTTSSAEVWGQATWAEGYWQLALHTPQGHAAIQLHVAGRHNVRNALAAAASALAAGISLDAVQAGLQGFRAVKGRSQLHRLQLQGRAVSLIDDSYNANPDSVRAAIDVLADLPGPRWLVLGDMGEVGEQGPQFHAEVGAYAATRGIEHLWAVGDLAQHAASANPAPTTRHFATVAEVLSALAQAPAAASVVVKGSRFMKTEQVVQALQAQAAATGDV